MCFRALTNPSGSLRSHSSASGLEDKIFDHCYIFGYIRRLQSFEIESFKPKNFLANEVFWYLLQSTREMTVKT